MQYPTKQFRGIGEVAQTAPAQNAVYAEPQAIIVNMSLQASQELFNQGENIDNDGDFVLEAISGTQTGNYQLRIKLPTGRYFPDRYVNNSNLIGAAALPFPVEPPVVFRSGERLSFDIKDTSAAPNTVQLVFIGRKLLRTA